MWQTPECSHVILLHQKQKGALESNKFIVSPALADMWSVSSVVRYVYTDYTKIVNTGDGVKGQWNARDIVRDIFMHGSDVYKKHSDSLHQQ